MGKSTEGSMGLVDGNGGNSFELSQPTFHLALHKSGPMKDALVCVPLSALVCVPLSAGVPIRWTGALDWTTGLDYWTRVILCKSVNDVITNRPPLCAVRVASIGSLCEWI